MLKKRKQKIKSLFHSIVDKNNREQVLFVSANLINLGVGSIFWIIAARYYSLEQIGFAANAVTAAIFLGSFSLFGVNLTIMRKFSQDKTKLKSEIFTLTIFCSALAIILSSSYFLILWLSNPILFGYLTESIWTIVSFVTIVVCWVFNYIQEAVLVVYKKPKILFIRNSILGIIRLALIVLLSFISKQNYDLLLTWAVSMIVAFGVSVLPYLKKIQIQFTSIKTMFHVFKLSSIYFLIYQLIGSTAFILTTFITTKYGPEVNAIFYIGWTVAAFLYSIPRSTSLYSMPDYLRRNDKDKIARRTVYLSFILEAIFILLFVAIGKYVFLLFGKNYADESLYIFYILAVAVFPLTVVNVYFEMIRANDEFKKMILLSVIQPIFLIGLLMFDILIDSLYYVSGIWLVVQFILVGVVAYFITKDRKNVRILNHSQNNS